MKLKTDNEKPIFRIVIYDLHDDAKEKSRTLSFYKNGEDPALNEVAERIKKSLFKR